MNEIYIVKGKKYRVGLINKDDFLAKNPTAELFVEEEKEFGPQNEGKTSTTEQGTTVDVTEVSDTESLSVDGSSELTAYKDLTDEQKKQLNKQKKVDLGNSPEEIAKRKKAFKAEQAGILSNDIELDEVVLTPRNETEELKNFRLNTDLSNDNEVYASEKANENYSKFLKQAESVLPKGSTEEEITNKSIEIATNVERKKIKRVLTKRYLETLSEKNKDNVTTQKVEKASKEIIKKKALEEELKLTLKSTIGTTVKEVTNIDGDSEKVEVFNNPDLDNYVRIGQAFSEESDFNFDLTGLGFFELKEAEKNLKDFGDPNEITSREEAQSYNSLVNVYNEAIKNNKTVKLSNGKIVPKATFDLFVKSKENFEIANDSIQAIVDDISDLDVSIQNEAEDLRLTKKSYNDLDKLGSKAALVLGKIPYDLLGGASTMIADGIEIKQMANRSGVTPLAGMVIGNLRDFSKTAESYSKGADKLFEDYYKDDVSFEDAFSSVANLAEFSAQEIVGQFGNLAMYSMGMWPGSIAIGVTSYETQRRVLEEEEKNNILGTKKSALYKAGVATGYASAEVAFAAIPTINILKKATAGVPTKGILDGLSKFTLKQIGKTAVKDTAIEVTGESGTVMFQAGIDMLIGRKEANLGNLVKDVPHAAFSALLLSGTFTSVPLVDGMVSRVFSDYNSNQEAMSDLNKIKEISLELENLDGRTKEARAKKQVIKELTDSFINKLESKRKKLKSNLTKEGYEMLLAAEIKKLAIQEEAKNIAEGIGSDKSKQASLTALKISFDALNNEINDFKKDYKININLLPSKELNRLNSLAEQKLIGEGKKADKATIKIEAEKIYLSENFDTNIDKTKKAIIAVNKSGTEQTFNVYETRSEAIEGFKASLDARVKSGKITEAQAEAELNKVTEGIKSGQVNGFNYSPDDSFSDIVVVKENSINNGKTGIGLHELGHTLFTLGFAKDPEAFKGMAETVLSWLKENNESAYNRVSRNTALDVSEGRYDEVLTNFLEEVSSKRFDLEAKKNQGILGLLGLTINNGINKSTNTDGDFILQGDENVVEFLNSLSKKVKTETLTSEDVSRLKKGKTKQKVDSDKKTDTSVKESRSTVLEAINELVPSNVKTKQEFQNPRVFEPIYYSVIKEGGAINNYIKSRTTSKQETEKAIESVSDRLINFDPEALRKEGKAVGTKAFGEFIFANTNFGKLDAKKALFKESEKTKQEVPLDAPEATTQLADEVSVDETKAKSTTSKLRRVLGIKQGDEIYNLAKKVSGEIMTGDLPGKKVKTAVNREARKSELRKAVSNLMGTEKAIDEQFLNKNILEILKALPASDLVKLEREAKVKVLAEQGPRLNVKDAREAVNKGILPKDTNLQSGPKVSSKLPTTLEQAKEFFTQKRKAGLVNVVTEMLVKDAAPEVTEGNIEPAKRAKVLSEIDRAPTLKFSQDYKDIAALTLNTDAKGQPLFRPSNIKLVRKEIMKFFGFDYVNKKDTGKAYSTRNRNAKLPENIANKQGETFIEGSTRVVGDFLNQNPKWRNALRASTTAGVERGLFTTTKVFEKLFPIKKGVKQEGIRYGYTGKGKLLSQKFADLTKEKDFVENQYKQIDNLIDFFLDVEAYLKKNPKDAWVFDAIVKDAQDNQNSIFRSSAPILFLATDSNGKLLFNVPLRQEHSKPQNNVSTMLLDMAINGRVKQDSKAIKASYMQGGITMADDGLLDVDYKFTMPDIYWEEVFPRLLNGDLKLPNGLAAVIRMTESGVNLDNLKYLVTGKSISEFFFDTKGVPVEMQKELISDYFTGKKDLKLIKDIAAKRVLINPAQIKASKSNNDKSAFKFSKAPTNKVTIETAATTDKALNIARDLDAPIKKIRVFDFDDTLAQTKSDVLYTMPDGAEGKLNAEQFASDGSTLLSEGAVFDFSEFNKVTEGKKGPLFKVAQTIAAKRGTEDVFVLTARAPESQLAIYEFLKSQGLDIPLKNITGLGDSTGDAKARWILDKAADGYNDFYFADDAPQNVKAVKDALSVLDVKSKTQQAKIKFSKSLDLDKDFNDIIENKTGIASDKTYARVKAEVAGANKGRFNFFIPPSAEDFVGLLYSTLGKGDVGTAQMAWYKAHLLNPFARAMENLANDRVSMMQDYRGLKKALKIVPKDLRKKIKDSNFTKEQAVRVFIWDKQGMSVPGLSQKDQKELVDYVNADAELTVFAEQLIDINKGDEYVSPDAGWVAGTIDTDFIKALNTTKRSKYLETWQQNADIIFSEANLNKLEAAYGKPYRVALENMLHRMKTGRNRSFGTDTITARFTDWLTNSVGAIMFFNTRSAVLQTISAVNFINFTDNNVLKAGQAFANQPQYWSDFKKLFNSPFLLDRRSGIKLNVNEADIAEMAKGPGNSARNVVAGLLKLGFLPTQIADSFAIASGGATFYRNRIKALKKEGLTEAEAEEIAFRDFREIAEESQQSSRPDKISQQQAGPLGRIVLAFANTPAQYARLIKKAASDLKNGRGDAKTNISKIIYYGVAQNLLFSALQQALFAIGFGDEDEEEEKRNEKYFNIANGMADSILRGIGVGGAVVSVVKNTAIRLAKEADKKAPKYQDAVVKGVLQISPPVSSKVGKLQSAGRSFSWNQEEMKTMGFNIDNPAYLASAQVISAVTNVPLDRAIKKITNIKDAGDENIEYYKRVALALGWSAWELGIKKDSKGKVKKVEPKTDMDKLYDLNKKQQIDSLLSLGLSKKQIKALKLEEDRVKAILDPKSVKTIKVSKRDSLFGLNKKDQVKALEKLGLTKKEIRALRLESDRVEAIINKQKQEN